MPICGVASSPRSRANDGNKKPAFSGGVQVRFKGDGSPPLPTVVLIGSSLRRFALLALLRRPLIGGALRDRLPGQPTGIGIGAKTKAGISNLIGPLSRVIFGLANNSYSLRTMHIVHNT
jgi:hypothetical protein